ncbi:MAG: FAD:protein FMN transferase [Acidobacteria bacterium]|nr:FAD:protein FMN transferase [Acidobacteriota bacterium]
MGTLIRISVYSSADPTAAMLAAKRRFEELDARLSHYKPDSEVNQLKAGVTIRVSPDLFNILQFAQRLSLLSGGAFDVTVRGNPVGYQNIALGRQTVTLLKEGVLLDLGGIAKGYANDQASRVLAASGFKRHLIAASGDVLARGKPGWTVGFQQTERVLINRAVSTSGNTYQPGHILDPRSGQRVMSTATVSVLARDSMTADALATACLILKGTERAALIAAYAGAEVVSA